MHELRHRGTHLHFFQELGGAGNLAALSARRKSRIDYHNIGLYCFRGTKEVSNKFEVGEDGEWVSGDNRHHRIHVNICTALKLSLYMTELSRRESAGSKNVHETPIMAQPRASSILAES